MSLTLIIFYVFAIMAVASGVMVVISNNPVRSALFLVLAFFASAGLWLLADAEFLALVLILVYVGAVMTLFLFVIMMLNLDTIGMKQHFVRYLPIGLGILILLIALMVVALQPEQAHFAQLSAVGTVDRVVNNTKALGAVLYTDYAYAFEIAGLLLLVAIIAAITLAHRAPRNCKTQNVRDQVQVKAKDRIQLVEGK